MKPLTYIFFLVFVYLCSVGVRYHQYLTITADTAYSADGQIILTTSDGYRWLRYASDYQLGSYADGLDRLTGIPNIRKPPRLPLLSLITAKLSDAADINIEKAGGLLSVWLPGLFIFPLGIFFYMVSFPSAGIGACLMGALSFAYLSRTSAFQIDTDMLNFFWLAAGAMFLVLAEKKRSILWSGTLGLTMYIFWRWYFHSGFTLIYFLLLIYALKNKSIKTIMASALLYIVLASPTVFLSGFRSIYEFLSPSAVRFVYADVAELHTGGFVEILGRVSPYWYIVMAGLLLSFLLGRYVIYLAVFYILGLFAFTKGVRFTMFLAPLCGAGVGVLFDILLKDKYTALKYSVVTALMLLFILKPFLDVVPPPVTDADTYSVINKLNETESDSLIASIWDNGFLIEYLTGRAVYADGASQFKVGAEIVSRALLNTDSEKAASILNSAAGGRPVYMLFTKDMDSKMTAIIKTAGLTSKIADENGKKAVLLKPVGAEGMSGAYNVASSLYFRLFVIGEPDIKCFDKIYSDNSSAAIYRVQQKCK